MAFSKKPDGQPIGSRARRSRLSVLGVATAFVIASFACEACKGTRSEPTAKDADASEARGARIVSLSPSTTEALFAIGAGESTVGRSRYCDYPAEAARLPQVGGYVDPSLEAILALRPTLVTGARGPAGTAVTSKLEARGIETYFPRTESFAEIDQMLLGLGEHTGHAAEATALVERLHRRLETIEQALTNKPRPRVLLVFGLDPLSVAGPESFANEMITHAHADNAVREGGTYPTLGVERVLSLDPDVIVNAIMGESRGKSRLDESTPGWSKVRAVRDHRVVPLADESLLRPGPRLAKGVLILARAVHPDVPLPDESP